MIRRSAVALVICAALSAWSIAACRADEPKPFTNEDYARHVEALKKTLPADTFHIVIEPPFVVIGDEAERIVKLRSEQTVRWAVQHLKKLYFRKDPRHILNIYLFRNKESYRKHAKDLFGDEPTTPYGYYSSANRALVMNISTGGGTLVHEIVHPFIETNFPGCPSWFNEGLGSLYEQSSERDGAIVGQTNWRLRGLQDAIKAAKVPSFKELLGTTTSAFYGSDRGTNYAQARYLCYYLQEMGLLQKFYQQFTANCTEDPGGYETLKKVLGEDDMDAFKKKWEAWVLKLTFP